VVEELVDTDHYRSHAMKGPVAKDVMTREVVVVPDDMSVNELAVTLMSSMISGAPVVDDSGALVGVVSATDIVRGDALRASEVRESSGYYLRGWEDRMDEEELRAFRVVESEGLLVRDIMTPLIFSVSEDATIGEMADVMIKGRIHRLIVTRDDQVVGIVTTLDLLRSIRDQEGGR
jgi:CBS domain-containing protein